MESFAGSSRRRRRIRRRHRAGWRWTLSTRLNGCRTRAPAWRLKTWRLKTWRLKTREPLLSAHGERRPSDYDPADRHSGRAMSAFGAKRAFRSACGGATQRIRARRGPMTRLRRNSSACAPKRCGASLPDAACQPLPTRPTTSLRPLLRYDSAADDSRASRKRTARGWPRPPH
jgi:hypothetical protein